MANYVTNEITIKAKNEEELDKFLKFIQRDGDVYGSFDFNKVIPMPESLNMTEGSITNDSVNAYISYMRLEDPYNASFQDDLAAAVRIDRFGFFTNNNMSMPEIEKMADKYKMTVKTLTNTGKQYIENMKQYGAATWFGWCNDNWNTKWNTPDGSVLKDNNILRFDTAWAPPDPVIQKLSEKFPSAWILHKWADEDLGYNVGSKTYLDGKVIFGHIPDAGSKTAYEMAALIKNVDLKDYCLRFDESTGTYECDESLEEDYPFLSEMIEGASEKAALKNGALEKQSVLDTIDR